MSGTFSPDELELLTQVLDHHCSAHGIESALEREDVARCLLAVCHSGLSSAESLIDLLEERWCLIGAA